MITNPVAQILNQIFDYKFSWLDFRVQPTQELARLELDGILTHHFVNVFCWTVIHFCCSANAIFVKSFWSSAFTVAPLTTQAVVLSLLEAPRSLSYSALIAGAR